MEVMLKYTVLLLGVLGNAYRENVSTLLHQNPGIFNTDTSDVLKVINGIFAAL